MKLKYSDKTLQINGQKSDGGKTILIREEVKFDDIFGVQFVTRMEGSTHCIDIHTFAK